jgi:hypothetical protein
MPAADTFTLEKKTTAAAKITVQHTQVPGPADEPDAGILTGKKKDNAAVKKSAAKDDDDILKDATLANGFNTGIKKDNKKKNP